MTGYFHAMKKYLLLAVLLPLLAACKKNSGSGGTGGTYYMKFKLNGVQKNYSSVAGSVTDANGYHIMVLSGASATNAQGEAMAIALNSVEPFSKGEIFKAEMIPGKYVIQALLSYADKSLPGTGYTSSYPNLTPNATALLTISEVSADNVKGTFSCKLVDEADFSTQTFTVSDGEFNIKLTHQ